MVQTINYYNLIRNVKEYKDFLTVDELNARLKSFASKKLIRLVEIGKSGAGNPIYCAIMGEGKDKESVLFFGFPHPNEPYGSLSCIELIKLIARNKDLSDRFTWYIIPCSDPDGAKLNEGWFKGKLTIKKYIYNYYRSGPGWSTEWSFPVSYKDYRFSRSPKNAKAMASLIRRTKPLLIYPAHDSGFSGGAYFFISDPMLKGYYAEIFRLCKSLSIPLHMGSKEEEFVEVLKKPVYKMFGLKDYYEYYKSKKKPLPNVGESAIKYAKYINPNAFGLLAEIPYAYDPRITNTSISSKSKSEIFKEAFPLQFGFMNLLEEVFRSKYINRNSIFWPVFESRYIIDKTVFEINKKKLQTSLKGSCTIAEEFSEKIGMVTFRTARLGAVRKLLLDSVQNSEIIRLTKQVDKEMKSRLTYLNKHSNYTIFPIRKLIQLQLGFLLLSINYMKRR